MKIIQVDGAKLYCFWVLILVTKIQTFHAHEKQLIVENRCIDAIAKIPIIFGSKKHFPAH
jgi:hypothetical protein